MKEFGYARRDFLALLGGLTTSALFNGLAVSAEKSSSDETITGLSLLEVSSLVRRREISPVEVTLACLDRIEQYDDKINAFITVCARQALSKAKQAEKEILAGNWRGPLHGIPIALKDNIDTAGIRTTAGSAVYADRVPVDDAEVVRRLKKSGAVILGKLNMDEFAAGNGGYWGWVNNPWSLQHSAGGSSSGSAAAVAADFCFAALGTDTGGSIRTPSSFCGIAGLKPSYGLVSNRGVVPLAESLDHVGPMCKTVADAALVLQVIAGYDTDWIFSEHREIPDYSSELRINKRPELAIPQAGFLDNLDPEVTQIFDVAVKVMAELTSISEQQVNVPQYTNIFIDVLQAEMQAFHQPLFKNLPWLYQEYLAAIVQQGWQGRAVSATEYLHSYRDLLDVRQQAGRIFPDGLDLLVMPTWKEPPMTNTARANWRMTAAKPELWNTVPFNVLGLPAISVPCGFTKDGLPVGVQIVGKPYSEQRLLAFAHKYEQHAGWHLRKPEFVT